MTVTMNFTIMNDMTVDEVSKFLEEIACKITDHEKSESIDIVDVQLHCVDE